MYGTFFLKVFFCVRISGDGYGNGRLQAFAYIVLRIDIQCAPGVGV